MCRPLAGNENSCHTLEKPLVPRVGKQSPRLKILENSWGGGGHQKPPGTENPRDGGANQRVFYGGGIGILISGTTH